MPSSSLKGGLSKLGVSETTFHCPSACFRQTVVYFPFLVTGLPSGSFVVSSNVPILYPKSPALETSAVVALQVRENPGAENGCEAIFSMSSLPTARGASGGRKCAPSAKNETNEAMSGGVSDQALSALRIATHSASRSTSSVLGAHPAINRLRSAAKR